MSSKGIFNALETIPKYIEPLELNKMYIVYSLELQLVYWSEDVCVFFFIQFQYPNRNVSTNCSWRWEAIATKIEQWFRVIRFVYCLRVCFFLLLISYIIQFYFNLAHFSVLKTHKKNRFMVWNVENKPLIQFPVGWSLQWLCSSFPIRSIFIVRRVSTINFRMPWQDLKKWNGRKKERKKKQYKYKLTLILVYNEE